MSEIDAYELDEPRRANGHDGAADPTLLQWARFRDQFAARFGDGFWTLEELEERIADRRAFFFPGKGAALVGQIDLYPGGERAFRVLWSVGDVAEAAVILPGVEALARMMGCTSMLVEDSELATVAGKAGYGPFAVTLHKGLTDG
jgi:hypothetical protein